MQVCTCNHGKIEHRFGVDRCTRCACTQFKLQEPEMHEGTITTLPESGPFAPSEPPSTCSEMSNACEQDEGA